MLQQCWYIGSTKTIIYSQGWIQETIIYSQGWIQGLARGVHQGSRHIELGGAAPSEAKIKTYIGISDRHE